MAKDVSKYARFDPMFLTDGLFVPTARKGQALYEVGREYDHGEVRFKGVQLTAAHQSVLLAVCARTGRNGLLVRGTKDDTLGDQFTLDLLNDPKAGKRAVEALEAVAEAERKDKAIVECSAYSLLMDAGMETGGKDYKKVADLLSDLATVVLYRRVNKRGAASNLLSFVHDGDKMSIALNWRLAESILGEAQNIQVSLLERHNLQGSVARLLHAWLSAHIRQGFSLMDGQGAKLDTLARHIWGNRPVSDSVKWKRRFELKKAIVEIGQLDGWAASVDGRNIARFSRPCFIEKRTPGQQVELKKRADQVSEALADWTTKLKR